MKSRIIFVLILLSFLRYTSAQGIKFSMQTGIGFYDMRSFSAMTEEVKKSLPFESKIMSNYPAFLYYQPMVKFVRPGFEFGFVYLFQTTGSHISSADYSGEYSFKSHVNDHSPGIIFSAIVPKNDLFSIGLNLQAGVNYSTLVVNEKMKIGEQSEGSSQKLKAMSAYIEPSLSFIFPVKQFSIELNIGYFKETFRETYLLVDDDESGIEVNKKFIGEGDVWDGARIGITLSYLLLKKQKQE